MKSVSELDIEVIQSGDSIHLFDRKDNLKPIACSKKVEGLPLLIIEDEVEKLADEWGEDCFAGPREYSAFIDGYNSSQKAHPYSEEDLRKAMNFTYWF